MVGAVKVISGTAHPELAEDICKCLGIGLSHTTVVRFSNENMLVQIDENVREADVFVIQPSCPPVSDGIIELLMTIDALKQRLADVQAWLDGGRKGGLADTTLPDRAAEYPDGRQ